MSNKISVLWNRIPIIIQALILMLSVTMIGTLSWSLLLILTPFPWTILIMGGILFGFVLFFSGRWGHKATQEFRWTNFRLVKLPSSVWLWSIVAIILFVVISQAMLVVTFRLIPFPSELFTIYNLEGVPVWVAWPFVFMAAMVAGICEEIGFRGYGQVPLEKRYDQKLAIAFVSITFIIFHLNQAWLPPIFIHGLILSVFLGYLAYLSGSLIPVMIAHTSMDVFLFSYWWSDLLGTFIELPIYITGIDISFIFWTSILIISTILFLWTMQKLNVIRQQKRQKR
ncbi:MAG: type II CAAX endopeptidase family protein [Candidatus Hermodarchaeota archaeon]|nr:type II CAAX endopeptidase family protein [Candidatus Hermodarchaeota archaeon]